MKLIVAFALVLCVGSEASLPAKGLTSKIRIKNIEGRSTVELTNRNTLDRFDVWAGPGTFVNEVEETRGFIIDWLAGVVGERPRGLRRYEVSFFVSADDSGPEDLAYVVLYEHDPGASRGFVYLPGRADAQYPVNAKTIIRGNGLEGNWFRATSDWQRMFGVLMR
jgi:hypothetical protein